MYVGEGMSVLHVARCNVCRSFTTLAAWQNIMYLNKLNLAKDNVMGTYINDTKAYSIFGVAEQLRNVSSKLVRRSLLGATETASRRSLGSEIHVGME